MSKISHVKLLEMAGKTRAIHISKQLISSIPCLKVNDD